MAINFPSSPSINDVHTENSLSWRYNGNAWLTVATSNIESVVATGSTEPRSLSDRFADTVNVKDFGAVGDGVTDDTVAIQAALNSTASLIVFPSGSYLITSSVTIPSNKHLRGDGIGVTNIVVNSSLPLTDPVFVNNSIPVNKIRQNKNISFSEMTFDGSGRTYIQYPANGYTTKGNIVKLMGVINPIFNRIEIKDHQSIGISDEGGLNLSISDSIFRRCGKTDDISSPVYTHAYGSVRKILGITNSSTATVTCDSSVGSLTNGQPIYIEGSLMSSIPDGDYTVANVSGNTFELLGVNTASDSVFNETMEAFVGWAGNTSNMVPSENALISNCHFYNNSRSAVSFMPVKGGVLKGCTMSDSGESAIFCTRAMNISIADTIIDTTTLTDIASNGVEFNFTSKANVSNCKISSTALDGVALIGCVGVNVNGNIFRNIIRNGSLTYPVGPLSTAAGIDGNAVTEKSIIRISSFSIGRCSSILLSNNIVLRSPRASEIVKLIKAGGDNLVSDVSVLNNDFINSEVTPADMIKVAAGNVCKPETLNIRGNTGHTSEFPVVLQDQVLTASTGVRTYELGFVPRMITVEAAFTNSNNQRTTQTVLCRDRNKVTSGSLGLGFSQAIDGVETSSTVDIDGNLVVVTDDFYRITDGSNNVIGLAEFSSWSADSPDGLGVKMNVITAVHTVKLCLTFHP